MKLEIRYLKQGLILSVLFFCTLLLQGETKIVFDDVLKPEELYVEGERVYIYEEDVIKVFSLTSCKKLFQLTNTGEGPSEFKSRPILTFFPEYIAATGRGKVIFYQRDGKIIEEKRVPSNLQMFPVKDNYIGSRDEKDKKSIGFFRKNAIYDSDFKKIAELDSFVPESMIVVTGGKISRQNYYMLVNGNGFVTDGNDICLYDSQKGFYIQVFNSKGKKISTIKKNYQKVKVTSAYKDKRMNALKKNLNWGRLKKMFNFVFPDYVPAFRRVFINHGLLYVLTDTLEENVQNINVLNYDGKVLATSSMPNIRCRYFNKGKLYYFQESDDEKWVLHIRKLL